MNETLAPPTDSDRERRDTEYVRMAQLRYVEGYDARLATLHPMKRNRDGKDLNQREPKWKFCEVTGDGRSKYAEEACPGLPKEGRGGRFWPMHECERWLAGFLAADGICGERGLGAAVAAHPARVPRKPSVALAEPVEMFPDATLSREDARAHRERQERIRRGLPEHQFTLADEQG